MGEASSHGHLDVAVDDDVAVVVVDEDDFVVVVDAVAVVDDVVDNVAVVVVLALPVQVVKDGLNGGSVVWTVNL